MIVGDDGLQSWHGETDTYLGINIIRAAMAAQQGSKVQHADYSTFKDN